MVTAKNGSMVAPQKWSKPAVLTTVATTMQRVKKEMVRSAVNTVLMMKMARKVRPTLISMSSTMTFITSRSSVPKRNTCPSKSCAGKYNPHRN